MNHLKLKFTTLAVAFFFVTTSCNSIKTAVFNQYSYQKTTALKVEALKLMDEATTPYSVHEKEVDVLLLDIKKLMEYEKNKPNNATTFAMWVMLTDEDKNLLSGFFKRWKEKETFSPIFLDESKKQMLEAMDLLIQYEIKKDKESKENILDLINLNK